MHFEVFEEVVDSVIQGPPVTNWSWRLVDYRGGEIAQCTQYWLTRDNARAHLKRIMDQLRLYRKVKFVPLSPNS